MVVSKSQQCAPKASCGRESAKRNLAYVPKPLQPRGWWSWIAGQAPGSAPLQLNDEFTVGSQDVTRLLMVVSAPGGLEPLRNLALFSPSQWMSWPSGACFLNRTARPV